MHAQSKLVISQADFQKLYSLVQGVDSETVELLEEELSRASVVPDSELPLNVVSMNSVVGFLDVETGKQSIVTLVFPHEANIEAGKVSILTPVGSALIGLEVGQQIRWPFPNGKDRNLRVVSVTNSQTVRD